MMYWLRVVKRSNLLFLVFLLIHAVGSAQNTDNPYRIKTVVIDAGHGGKDPGNLGTGRYKTREKEIALDVALRVGGYIEKQFPEIKVVYTRKTDIFIGLNERADIANRVKADLFISIHCNAFSKTTSNGVETFVLGLHRNQENLQVAQKENSAIFLEDDYKTKYEGFDPNSAESIIALTIMQSAFLQQSLSLSSYIQKQFRERVGRKDRGVKQAGFLVLRRTTMPSVLIELGFLTNAAEEDFLNSENGKSYMSSAIFRGFKEYKDVVEDPIPEGYVEPKAETVDETPVKVDAEKLKQQEIAEKARQDSIKKVEDQAKLKAVADSLAQEKKKLEAEKKKREEELAKAEAAKKAKLKAQADSLEQVKLDLIAAKEKREAELKAKADAEQKAKEEAARIAAEKKAAEEKARKEEEQRKIEAAKKAKAQATEILEEIKEEKERELAEAKKQAAIDAEKKRLEDIMRQKEQELAEAKQKEAAQQKQSAPDTVAATDREAEKINMHSMFQARLDSLERVKKEARQSAIQDSIAKAKEEKLRAAQLAEKMKQDSIVRVTAEKLALEKAAAKAKQDSIDAAEREKAERSAITINNQKAVTPEEAELLFLQLRKKELEQRIAQLTGKNVSTEVIRQNQVKTDSEPDPAPKAATDAPQIQGDGIRFRVQIITSAEPLPGNSPQFKGQKVQQYQQGGLYKYTVGNTVDFKEITKLQGELRNLGFKGAFVVAFNNSERIKVSEAKELLNE